MLRLVGWLCILPALASLLPGQTVSAAGSFASAMAEASQARNVPLPLIEATAYINSRWEWIKTPAADGGVGPMHVMPAQMASATSVSGHSRAQIASDLSSNLDAGAALLANAHTGANDLVSWRPAVAATQGVVVATQIFDALGRGVTRTTSTGEQITLLPQGLPTSSAGAPTSPKAAAPAPAATDYSGATWVPADPANYTVADRPHDYPVTIIIIHDTESSYGAAIQEFQNPAAQASAHYVISDTGLVTQMVAEKDIAWHAGNWDYNTRAIGIEHEGYAWTPGWYTLSMYEASAYLAATICSRWGVPLDRNHVIGHNEVPDPNNPSLTGGVDHHTDPGPYWDWAYYLSRAVHYASGLPSPPRMMPDPVASNGLASATVTWLGASTCHSPITGYTVTAQPGNLVMNLSSGARSATFNNLQPGTTYTFTVTATNADGQDSLTSNAVVPGHCNLAHLSGTPSSPQPSGTTVRFTGTSAGCPNPLYQFWTQAPGSSTWTVAQAYSSSATFDWNTGGGGAGAYNVMVWARDSASSGTNTNGLGTYDDSASVQYTVTPAPCTSVAASAAPASQSAAGTTVTITGVAAGCPSPRYEFWVLPPGSSTWQIVQAYSTSATLTWTTADKPAGVYRFGVWARDGTSSAAYDTFTGIQHTLTPVQCTSPTASATPASPSSSGTAVTITGSASGCPSPLYEFWILAAGSSTWRLVQGYSTSATYSWNSTGALAGTEHFGVWVRDASSSAAYDAYVGLPYSVTTPSCASATGSAAPATVMHGSGTQVAITGAASGCTDANPLYEFWMKPAGSSKWLLVQGYSTNATYNWNSTGAVAGTETFGVWVKDANSPSSYDAYASFPYTVS